MGNVRKNREGYMEVLTANGWEPMNGETIYNAVQPDEYPRKDRREDLSLQAILQEEADRYNNDWRNYEKKERQLRTKLY